MSVLEYLKREFRSNIPEIITIDGRLASGKTTLANEICQIFGYILISIDDFLDKRIGKYFDAINFEKLTEFIVSTPRPLIIEGICIAKVVETLGITPDYRIFLSESVQEYQSHSDELENEVENYLEVYVPAKNANLIIRNLGMTNQHDVDIAYLKSRTLFSALLALGGILSILVGAILLNAGLHGDDSAIFKILGAEISAKGIGGVILATSAVWAYLAYRSRPVYRHKKETKKTVGSDGSVEEWETESSTRLAVNRSDNDS